MDAPWIVMDSSVAKNAWNWRPKIGINKFSKKSPALLMITPIGYLALPELMKINFCDLTLPENSERIIWEKAIGLVQSNGFILGTEVTEFEDAFANYCETEYSKGVATGCDALLWTMEGLGIGKGDEVITVANTFIGSVLPIIKAGRLPF